MQRIFRWSLAMIVVLAITGCNSGQNNRTGDSAEDSGVVIKRRDDGTKSSAGKVDEKGYVHGVLVNFYEDGKTVHSRITYEHGSKQGPAVWYYKNGQVYEHTGYAEGKKQGPTKRYYENGNLMEELTYEAGEVVPGSVKKYSPSGKLITD